MQLQCLLSYYTKAVTVRVQYSVRATAQTFKHLSGRCVFCIQRTHFIDRLHIRLWGVTVCVTCAGCCGAILFLFFS